MEKVEQPGKTQAEREDIVTSLVGVALLDGGIDAIRPRRGASYRKLLFKHNSRAYRLTVDEIR